MEIRKSNNQNEKDRKKENIVYKIEHITGKQRTCTYVDHRGSYKYRKGPKGGTVTVPVSMEDVIRQELSEEYDKTVIYECHETANGGSMRTIYEKTGTRTGKIYENCPRKISNLLVQADTEQGSGE